MSRITATSAPDASDADAAAGASAAFALVAEPLAGAEQALRELLISDVTAVPAVAGWLADAGGKRLRPLLTALAARAVGWERPIARLMCAGEMIHLGSLLHDDVVDEAEHRRGRLAAHQVYGNAVSVLTGDFCLARAVALAAEEGGYEAVSALAQAVTEMAEGEVLQLQKAGDLSCTYGEYLTVIDRKSAALIAWCAAAPAYAQGDLVRAEALSRYGRGVGVAFQITDDVLDYRGDTGKDAGADLRQRKVTLPLLIALDRDPGLRTQLAEPPRLEDLPALVERVRRTGALDAALAEARQRADDAARALDLLPDTDARRALRDLARYLVERSR